MNLNNKVVVVTGASEGIGKQIAFALARKGARLALIARNQEKLDTTASESLELGALAARVYSCDVSDTQKFEATLESIIKDFGEVDVLINNAGMWQKLMDIDEATSQQVGDVIMTNIGAVIQATRILLPHLRKQEDAAIINVSSKAGVVPQAGMSLYSATKYGLRGFTDVLKEDLKNTNVRVAGIYQAGVKTSMLANGGETATMPIEKFSDPKDLAEIVVFMLSQPPKIWIHDIRVQF